MDVSSIAKLERVPLREVWKHEAIDFTQWLQENIDVLNEVLDLDLVNVDRERATGDFSIDLVAEDGGGGTIIIENQLEQKQSRSPREDHYLPDRHERSSGDLDCVGPPTGTRRRSSMAE